ncbi:CHASE2 domain-containing protein [Saccharospirillum mangrovi]|uniref:CHASE2 domain-containing protein n=1 Tax=Saccharospirillum mangrovi TaxID=2161747 RepID=UPI0013B43AF4|nr:adenylate/guanylate cyclase domain-containing protein [Saccharospirillum mangrovi]
MRFAFTRWLSRHGLRWAALSLGFLITLSLAGYHLFVARYDQTSFIQRLDYLFYDWRFQLLDSGERFPRADDNIVIVDIDEASLKTEGRWPWPRDKVATLVNQLAEAGAVVVGIDILMSEPQLNPTRQLQQQALADGNADLAESLTPFLPLTEYDQILADSFANIDVVLPFLFQADDSLRIGQLPAPVYELTDDEAERLLVVEAEGYAGAVDRLQQAAVTAGSIVPTIDGDGTLRSAPLFTRYEDGLYPSLALAMGLTYYFLDGIELDVVPFNARLDVIDRLHFADKTLRVDAGRVLVPYLGPQGQFPYVSATDVIRGQADPDVFANALVLIGTSSVGLADLRTTPVGTQFPGVEVHANLLNGLLAGNFPYTPDYGHTMTAVLLLILGAFFTLVSNRLGPLALASATLLLLAALVSINFYLWLSQQMALPLASSVLLTAALGTLHLLEGFLSERRHKQQVTNVFGQYVPKAHIERMLSNPDAYGFEGENRDMTVLFSDVRSFTTISEKLSATQLKDLLNRYFTPITEVIFNHQGTIDKYVGDMVMAFWGAPLEDPEHPRHALEAAVAMIATTEALNPELQALGYPEIQVGIGLNTGPMNVGDMGSTYRRAYTVLGDAVNLGSRLESLTKFYGVKILIGPQTRAAINDWAFRPIDRIRVKGKTEPVAVFEPWGKLSDLSQQQRVELDALDAAYQLYLQQQWSAAKEAFSQLKTNSRRAKLYDVYLERIEILEQEILPEDWDGSFTHTSK